MSEHSFMIDAWNFSSAKPEKVKDIQSFQSHCWYHCQRTDEHLSPWLESIGVEKELMKAVMTADTRPCFQKLGDDCFFMILRGVNLNPGADPDDMLTLGLLYHQGSLITLRRRQFKAIQSIREDLENAKGPSSLPALFISMIELINDRIGDVLQRTEGFIETVEDEIDSLNKEQQHDLTLMHRRLLKLSRFLKPQAGALEALEKSHLPLLDDIEQKIINERNESQAISESIESYLAHIWILREHMQQALSEMMGRNTYWLSMIAGVFLPLGFLTGLFGINIAGMPGTDMPEAFELFCIGLAALGVVEFLLFRRLKFL